MGNGISRTYPTGILKAPPKSVQFGKPEVRVVRQDRWETTPLLNTHEVNRIEAKIRAAEMKPIEPPKPAVLPPLKKEKHPNRRMLVLASVAVTTGIVCAAAGPFGLIIPAVALLVWGLHKFATRPPAISKDHKQATINAVQHLEKLARKHEIAGLTTQAQVYRDMAMQYRIRYKL